MLPNIVFITCHDLGKHLNCYGQETVTSPNLDALANCGIVMDEAYCTAPQCSPSRSALHTGRHAHTNGVMGLTHEPFNWRLYPTEKHIAHLLKEGGYTTALVGEQHLTPHPQDLGYEFIQPNGPAPATAEKAYDYLRTAKQRGEPFYLEVGFVEPHRTYDYGGAKASYEKGVAVPPYLPNSKEARRDFADLQGAIAILDTAVGRVVQALRDFDLIENTWLIFTVDHGLAMPRAKGTLYDPGLEIALIMHWPAQGLTGGRRYNQLVSHVDVVPTILEGVGLPLPNNLQGHSYWPLLKGEAYNENEAIFGEKTYHTAYEPMRAIRTRTHKLIVNFEVGPLMDVPDDIRHSPIYPLMLDLITGQRPSIELYDLKADPLEINNLAGMPEQAGIEQDLKDRLLNWMEKTRDPLLDGPVPSPFYQKSRQSLSGNMHKGIEQSPHD
jgi:N-sulfoglucosamine sulfohydrolase